MFDFLFIVHQARTEIAQNDLSSTTLFTLYNIMCITIMIAILIILQSDTWYPLFFKQLFHHRPLDRRNPKIPPAMTRHPN